MVSVTLAILGPKILARATNLIFEGFLSSKLPPGVTKEQAIAMLEAGGQTQLASMLSSMHIVPGGGIDFAAVSRVLAIVAAIYLASALFSWLQGYIMAGVVQRVVFALRRDVDLKLARLPLKYFDDHARGDILSRVTNDIDNIANTLQQTLTQIITAVFTLIGVLIMMFSISPMLAGISLITVPLLCHRDHVHRQAIPETVQTAMGTNRHSERVRGGDAYRTQPREGVRAWRRDRPCLR